MSGPRLAYLLVALGVGVLILGITYAWFANSLPAYAWLVTVIVGIVYLVLARVGWVRLRSMM
jgi:hypothetical protein